MTGHGSASVPAMNARTGSRGHWPSNGIDKHDDGLSRVGQFAVDHFDREDHVVAPYQRSFAQGYNCFGDLASGTNDRNGGIGRIVGKGVFPLRDQFHERISIHVAGGSHRAIAEKDDIRIGLFESQQAAIENHRLGVLYE